MYDGALLPSMMHHASRGGGNRTHAPKEKNESARSKLVRTTNDAPDTIVRKSVGRWSKPFIAVANHAAHGVLRLRGYKHRTVETPQGRMHAMVCEGSGKMPPIIMLPGLGSRVGDYTLLLWRLKPRFQKVVAIDLPGHGKSQMSVPINSDSFANAILSTKTQLLPEPAFMMGHSLGGLGTMRSYLLAPHEVLAMTLVTPPGGPTPPDLVREYSRQFDIHRWRDARHIADMTAPRTCWPHLFTPAIIAQRLMTRPVRELLLSDVLTSHVTPEDLARMPQHTMFVWAGRECLLPAAHRRYFLRHLPATAKVWEPGDMNHGDLAWGKKQHIQPIFQFFESATRELARDQRLLSRRSVTGQPSLPSMA